MLYNVKKSSCIAFIPKLYKDLQLPQMYLGESLLSWDDQQKYLGYIMTYKCVSVVLSLIWSIMTQIFSTETSL